jgi:hypothetical protein
MRVSATQLGAIGENIVASYLILASGGRLSPFKAVADDSGIDLLIYDKVTGRAVPVQVKSRTHTLARSPNTVHFGIRQATFNEAQHAYLLAVLFAENVMPLTVQRAWLIPMNEVRGIAADRTETLILRPCHTLTSADRYTPYRCTDLSEVAQRLMAWFDGEAERERAAIPAGMTPEAR